MSTYYVTIGKNEYMIEIANNQFKINGRTVHSKLTELGEKGMYLIRHGGWKQEIHIQPQGSHKYGFDLNGKHLVANVTKNKIKNLLKSKTDSSANIVAPMPGIVLTVQAEAGDKVTEGQVIVTMESMKMQLVLKASHAGVVNKINTAPRSQTAKGDVLVEIAPAT